METLIINRFAGHGWWMGWGWITGLLVLALFIWIAASIFSRTRDSSERRGKTALEILNERYARGEIDRAEYESMKKEIMGDAQTRKHDR